MKRLTAAFLSIGLACQAIDQPAAGVRHETVGPEDIPHLATATFQYSSIVLPEGEKAMTYLCGDPKHWDVQIIENAEGFVNVKPSPGAHPTDIQILTDHNHNYTIQAEIKSPGDVKLFLESTDPESIRKPATFVPVSALDELKREKTATEQKLADALRQQQVATDQVKVNYPQSLRFKYKFDQKKPPFWVESIWNDADGKTYLKMHPEETPSLYDFKDGKPNLIQFATLENGQVFRVDRVLQSGILQVGKKKLLFTREADVN